MNTIEAIQTYKIIAIARKIPYERLLPTAEALFDGGIRLLEVTFDHSKSGTITKTTNMISALCMHFGCEMYIGAGTVLSEEEAEMAILAGAKYIISPNFSPSVVAATSAKKAVSIPGALTPTEIVNAYSAGANFVKLFPAGNLGIGYFKSIMSPISHIPLLATGGINDKNLQEFLNLGVAGVGVGSNIVNNQLIIEGKYDELTRLARKYTSQVKGE